MKKIGKSIRQEVVYGHQNGLSNAKIARSPGISPSSVAKILKEEICTDEQNHSGVRPKVLSQRTTTKMVNLYAAGHLENSRDGVNYAAESFGVDISKSTVKRILKEEGFRSYKKEKAPLLSETNIKKRKQYYHWAKNKTIEDWKKVIFTDESSFKVFRAEGGANILSQFKKFGKYPKIYQNC